MGEKMEDNYQWPSSRRNSGKEYSGILMMAESLKQGYIAGMMSPNEDGRIDRVISTLKTLGVDAKYRRITRKEPAHNLELRFDEWGEPIGVTLLDQTERFVGWEIYADK